MLVYRIDKKKYKDTSPPRGSIYSEGRWNTKGMFVVYTSESVSLAKLEVLANSGSKIPKNRVLRIFDVDDSSPLIQITTKDLPKDWQSIPYPNSLPSIIKNIIDSGAYVGAIVPSAQSPRDNNILLFPEFKDFRKYVREVESEDEFFDPRLKR